MSAEAKPIPKPQLRGFFMKQMKRNFVLMAAFSISCTLLFKVLYVDPKKKKYEEFYKTYDPEERIKIMVDAGLMQSAPETFIPQV